MSDLDDRHELDLSLPVRFGWMCGYRCLLQPWRGNPGVFLCRSMKEGQPITTPVSSLEAALLFCPLILDISLAPMSIYHRHNAANLIKGAFWKLVVRRRLALVLCCVRARGLCGNQAVPVELIKSLTIVLTKHTRKKKVSPLDPCTPVILSEHEVTEKPQYDKVYEEEKPQRRTSKTDLMRRMLLNIMLCKTAWCYGNT